MRKKYKSVLSFLIPLGIVLLAVLLLLVLMFLYGSNIAVLHPAGLIAIEERELLIMASLLMLIVVIPVFILTFAFAWEYRADNTKAEYNPNWDYNRLAEIVWWGFPCFIIFVLSIITWKYSRDLDPFHPIGASTGRLTTDQVNIKPLRIQVVALPWRWLFIYPEQEIATINLVQFPAYTPILFEITADAPMNSFWIPALSGQIYAMPRMRTELHLIADEIGEFRGSSANLSGEGFADMVFIAKASSTSDFDQWVQSIKQSPHALDFNEYETLAKPTINRSVLSYSLQEKNLFDQILMKYMMP